MYKLKVCPRLKPTCGQTEKNPLFCAYHLTETLIIVSWWNIDLNLGNSGRINFHLQIKEQLVSLTFFKLLMIKMITPVEKTLKTLINHRSRHQNTGLFMKEAKMQHQCNIDETLMVVSKKVAF